MTFGRSEIHQIVIHDQRPPTPPTPAVTMVKKHLLSQAKTQNAEPTGSRSATMAVSKIQRNDNTVTTSTTNEMDELVLDQIMAPSPAQPITRIEDSVEAIDAFEEAIEKVGELIPAISEGPRSPKKSTKAGDASHVSTNGNNKSGSNDSNLAAPSKGARPSNVESRGMTTRATSAANPRANPRRISSIHRAPFQPTKSTKPPTRSNFELPGEAVARKLKEQREERLKREEPPKKPFSGRPARTRLSQGPVVRQTITSNARLGQKTAGNPVVRQTTTSNARLSLVKAGNKASPLRQRASVDGKKRLSALSQAKQTRSSLTTSITGRSSTIGTPHALGMPVSSRAPIPASDTAQLKLRGKEVFNRNRVELDERERARKEKEEAARKARAEAAERGRIASREWAEKQRMKKTAMEQES